MLEKIKQNVSQSLNLQTFSKSPRRVISKTSFEFQAHLKNVSSSDSKLKLVFPRILAFSLNLISFFFFFSNKSLIQNSEKKEEKKNNPQNSNKCFHVFSYYKYSFSRALCQSVSSALACIHSSTDSFHNIKHSCSPSPNQARTWSTHVFHATINFFHFLKKSCCVYTNVAA